MHFNTARISNYNTIDSHARSDSELDGRRQIESIATFMVREVPGFENAYISSTENEVGVRESRHIAGAYRLTGDDILNAKHFDDVIARGLFAVDIHGAKPANGSKVKGAGGLWQELKDAYDIPYRILVPESVDGLLLAGRCVSADNVAFSSLRVQGTLMGYSQASGFAAAMCAKQGIQPRQLNVKELQSQLISIGASPYRNANQKAADEEFARTRVKEYLTKYPNLITPEKYLAAYRGEGY